MEFCKYTHKKSINCILNQKVQFDENHINNLFDGEITEIQNCIDIFVNFGYVVSKEILIKLLENNIDPNKNYIKDEYLNDKLFMENVSSLIKTHNMFPNNFDIKIGADYLEKIIKNKTTNFSEIKKLIKENNIKPTIECLRTACECMPTPSLIKYFVEKHDLEIDFECLENTVKAVGQKKLSYVFGKYKDKITPIQHQQPKKKNKTK